LILCIESTKSQSNSATCGLKSKIIISFNFCTLFGIWFVGWRLAAARKRVGKSREESEETRVTNRLAAVCAPFVTAPASSLVS
jgi:hypothetical protein